LVIVISTEEGKSIVFSAIITSPEEEANSIFGWTLEHVGSKIFGPGSRPDPDPTD
jgi:hypothetical protein